MKKQLLASLIALACNSIAFGAQAAESANPADNTSSPHQHHQHDAAPSTQGDAHAGHDDMGGMHNMDTKDGHQSHEGHAMRGIYGPYPMTRESSGTAWQPDSSPHEGIHNMVGDWSTMIHGYANLIYNKQGGPRGDEKTYSTSMLMGMGQRQVGIGTLGLRGMVSLDPLFGKGGYPLLFQTGETGNGQTPLIDRQHPHDLLMELSASYSIPLSSDSAVFGYVGLPGEPALGPATFMHRFSGIDNPEAPISHHWLDSTHITFGVTTLGYVYRNWKLEASAFHGREPDQFRYNIDTGRLDSSSVRLTWNPSANWSAQFSRGHIVSPEALEPERNVDRTTASVTHNLPVHGNNVQTTFAWGRNDPNEGRTTDAWLLESAYQVKKTHTFFGRVESVDKDELFAADSPSPLAQRSFRIGKLSAGYIYDFPASGHVRLGVGGLVSKYAIPSALTPVYGRSPTSGMVFLRVKFE